MHNMEIERKFLVINDTYKALATCKYHIVQGYICKDAGRTVRVRLRTEESGVGHAFLTIKSKPNDVGFARFEWEKEIAVDDARQLLQMCLPGLIEKTRWIVPYQPANGEPTPEESALKWEIDEFHGRMDGLVMAELELQREDQPYTRPAFLGEEVTGNPRYYNANM